VQSNQFAAKQVLARCYALRDGDGLHAAVGDEAVDAPFAAAVEAVLGYFEPAGYRGGGWLALGGSGVYGYGDGVLGSSLLQ
jgi:hypothetical protein